MADLLYSLGASAILAIPGIAKFYLPIVYPAHAPEHFKHAVSRRFTIPSPAPKTVLIIKRVTETAMVTATKTIVSASTETSISTAFETTWATITETHMSTTHRYITYFSNLRAGDGTPRSTFSAWCDEVTGPCAVRPTSTTFAPTVPTSITDRNCMSDFGLWKNLLLWLLLALVSFLTIWIYRQAKVYRVRSQEPSVRLMEEFRHDDEVKVKALEETVADLWTEIVELKDKLRVEADGTQQPLT